MPTTQAPWEMRIMRNVLLALLLLALGSNAYAQRPWAEDLFPNGTTHDFGTVPKGTQLFYRMKMKNNFQVPLEISTRVGCNCVRVVPSSNVIQPPAPNGGAKDANEAYLDIHMDGTRFNGFKTVMVYVEFKGNNGQFYSTANLTITATSRLDVVVNPGEINFRAVNLGQPAKESVDVEYAGNFNWQLDGVAPHSFPLDVGIKPWYRRPGQVGYHVDVALKENVPPGPFSYTLFLKTNDPGSPLVPLLVEGTVQASLSATPNPLNLGQLKVGDKVTRRVVVRGSRPFKVTGVEGVGDGVTVVDIPATQAQVQILTVKYEPAKAGSVQKQLKIKTDLKDEAIVTVEGGAQP